jgi:ferredoxin
MKVTIKPDLCCGAQLCAQVPGGFYRLEDGFNALVSESEPVDVPPEMEAAARAGAEACPETAIIIIDTDDD